MEEIVNICNCCIQMKKINLCNCLVRLSYNKNDDAIQPLKKRKTVCEPEQCFVHPKIEEYAMHYMLSFETKNRKKYPRLDKGLYIKYNKLLVNYDLILRFNIFYEYRILCDYYAKRHVIKHGYQLNWLNIFNKYSFHNQFYKICTCDNVDSCRFVCVESKFAIRKIYNQTEEKQIDNTNACIVYDGYSLLSAKKNFIDNKITVDFVRKCYESEWVCNYIDEKHVVEFMNHIISPHDLVDDGVICRQCFRFDAKCLAKMTHKTKFSILQIDANSIQANFPEMCIQISPKECLIPIYNKNEKIENHSNNLYVIIYKLHGNFLFDVYNSTVQKKIIDINQIQDTQVHREEINKIMFIVYAKNTVIVLKLKDFKLLNFFSSFNMYFAEKIPIATNVSTTQITNVNNIYNF